MAEAYRGEYQTQMSIGDLENWKTFWRWILGLYLLGIRAQVSLFVRRSKNNYLAGLLKGLVIKSIEH